MSESIKGGAASMVNFFDNVNLVNISDIQALSWEERAGMGDLSPQDKADWLARNQPNVELIEDIKNNGILVPILVAHHNIGQDNEFFTIVGGYKRYQAYKSLAWQRIPVVIRAANDAHTKVSDRLGNIYD